MSTPTNPGEEGTPSAEDLAAAAELYAQGHNLLGRQQWSEAEAVFFQAARLAPKASVAWLSAAIACWQQRRFVQAVDAIEWALHAAIPIRATPESEKGIKCYEAEDWPGVEEAFRALLEKASPESPTHLFLAIALSRLGRFDEAYPHLVAAYQLELAESAPDTESG
jgi:Flp pilus assembly protein TadD